MRSPNRQVMTLDELRRQSRAVPGHGPKLDHSGFNMENSHNTGNAGV